MLAFDVGKSRKLLQSTSPNVLEKEVERLIQRGYSGNYAELEQLSGSIVEAALRACDMSDFDKCGMQMGTLICLTGDKAFETLLGEVANPNSENAFNAMLCLLSTQNEYLNRLGSDSRITPEARKSMITVLSGLLDNDRLGEIALEILQGEPKG